MPKGFSLWLYQHIDREMEFIQPLIALVVLAVDFVRIIYVLAVSQPTSLQVLCSCHHHPLMNWHIYTKQSIPEFSVIFKH